MDSLLLLIEPELDERAATASLARAQRVYEEGARDISRVMRQQLTTGAEQSGRAFDEMANTARRAYLGIGDATDRVGREEQKLARMRQQGADGVEAQARKVEKARLNEERAVQRAAAAYRDYEQAATQAGERSFSGAAASAKNFGEDAAGNFVGGMAGSSALARLGMATGPIGIALVAAAGLGVMAGKVLASNIAAGLATIQLQDQFQAAMGIDDASMARIASGAGAAYANNFGQSVADNLAASKAALQGGLIDTTATDADIRTVIQQLQGMSAVTGSTAEQLTRSVATLMRTGLAGSVEEASDIITAGFQSGLDISGDWLDTLNEYSTQFRKLGLDASEALTLLSQGLEGGARDTDKVADSLKEFSIRAVDGSKTTAEGFAALGFNADEMGRRFAAGGDSARSALDAVFTGLQEINDPLQQSLVWTALFGTQFEDMGDAINRFDLAGVNNQFRDMRGTANEAVNTATDNAAAKWEAASRSIEQSLTNLKTKLANLFTPFLESLAAGLDDIINRGDRIAEMQRNLRESAAPSVGMWPVGPPTGPGQQVFGPPSLVRDSDGNLVPGAAVANPDLGALLTGQTPMVTPSSDLPVDEYYKRMYPQPAADPNAPQPGDRTPMLTDSEKEAAKEAAGGGSASLPQAPSLPLQYSSVAGLPTAIANAQTRLDEARHTAAEKAARVNQLEQSNVATDDDIQKARNDAAKAERDALQAEQGLQDSKTKHFEQAMKASEKAAKGLKNQADQLSDIGAQLDDDFGVSKGLAGIFENITRFLANLAFAPAYGALSAVQAANGFKRGEAGSGVFGMAASSGAFGDQFVPIPAWARGSNSAAGGYAGVAGSAGVPTYGYGGAPSEAQVKQIAAQFGLQVTSEDRPGDPGYHGQGMALDISNGSGNTPEMRAFAEYMSQNFGPHLKELIYSDGSFRGQIGDGKNVSGTGYYSPGTLAEHQNHVHIAAQWGQAATGATTAMNDFTTATSNASSAMSGSGFNWDAVAKYESSGDWSNNNTGGHMTSSGAPRGGLQITDGTWQGFGGTEFAPTANLATREQQMAVADRIAFSGYRGNNPQGLGAWEVITNGSTAADGITVNSRPPGGGTGTGVVGPGMAGPPQSPFLGTGPGGSGLPALPGGVGASAVAGRAAPSQSVAGGRAWGQGQPASGGIGFNGGMIGAGLSAAMSAAGGMGGGAGGAAGAAAADMGMQLLGRAAGAGGQYAGAIAGGLLETFSLNDSALGDPSSSWAGRLLGAAAGVRPALPNTAGEMGGEQNENMAEGGKEPPGALEGQPPGPLTPEQAAQAAAGGDGGSVDNSSSTTNNVTLVNPQVRDVDSGMRTAQSHLASQSAARQPR